MLFSSPSMNHFPHRGKVCPRFDEDYRVAREFAEKNLEAENRKLAVGLSSNYFVLEAQDRLATARSNELRALVNYNLALARLEKVLGTSLTNRNINLTQVGQK